MASRPAPGPKSSALTRAGPCAASAAPVCFWVAVDHSSVRPSLSAVASVVPFPLNDKAATAAPVAMAAPGWLCVAVSQSRTSPSSPPAARTFPPGPNASALIAAGPAVIVVPTSSWVVASHNWTVPSLLPAATAAPSGLNATASTGARPELIGAPISCSVATSQSRTFPSPPPVASLLPSRLNVADRPPVTAVRPVSGCLAILARPARFHAPTAVGPATSRVLPLPGNASASAAPPQVALLTRRCEAVSQSRIVPSR